MIDNCDFVRTKSMNDLVKIHGFCINGSGNKLLHAQLANASAKYSVRDMCIYVMSALCPVLSGKSNQI